MIQHDMKARYRYKLKESLGKYWDYFVIPKESGIWDIFIILCYTLKRCMTHLDAHGFIYTNQYGILTKVQWAEMKNKGVGAWGYSTFSHSQENPFPPGVIPNDPN